MLSQEFSELRLTDPMSIVLIVILAGAIIGGSIMAWKDRRKKQRERPRLYSYINGVWRPDDLKQPDNLLSGAPQSSGENAEIIPKNKE